MYNLGTKTHQRSDKALTDTKNSSKKVSFSIILICECILVSSYSQKVKTFLGKP